MQQKWAKEMLPGGQEIINLCRTVIENWHIQEIEPSLDWEVTSQALAPDPAKPEPNIDYLAFINCFQWHLEDACRIHYQAPLRLAHLKQAIDQSNQRRVTKIDEIDQYVLSQIHQQRPEPFNVPVALITPGNLIDRLSILELKKYHALVTKDHRQNGTGIHRLLDEQIDDFCQGYDRLIDDLLSGRLRLKFYRTYKLYPAEK